jgi:hypothetical protein
MYNWANCLQLIQFLILLRSADGMVSVSPKKLVFNESNKNTTQMCKVEMRNKGRKNYVVQVFVVSCVIISGPVSKLDQFGFPNRLSS